MNPQKELVWGLWVGLYAGFRLQDAGLESFGVSGAKDYRVYVYGAGRESWEFHVRVKKIDIYICICILRYSHLVVVSIIVLTWVQATETRDTTGT